MFFRSHWIRPPSFIKGGDDWPVRFCLGNVCLVVSDLGGLAAILPWKPNSAGRWLTTVRLNFLLGIQKSKTDNPEELNFFFTIRLPDFC